MKNPYSVEEIRDILNVLNLTHTWLADRTFLSRQSVSFALNHSDQDDTNRTRNRLLFTYVIDDYIENETAFTHDDIEGMVKYLRTVRETRKQ